MFFDKKVWDDFEKEIEKWEKEDMDNDITDTQTKNMVQGINTLLCYYPEAKLSVDYDRQILLILPMDTKLKENVENTLKRLGWKNLETLPHIWKYQVEEKLFS